MSVAAMAPTTKYTQEDLHKLQAAAAIFRNSVNSIAAGGGTRMSATTLIPNSWPSGGGTTAQYRDYPAFVPARNSLAMPASYDVPIHRANPNAPHVANSLKVNKHVHFPPDHLNPVQHHKTTKDQ